MHFHNYKILRNFLVFSFYDFVLNYFISVWRIFGKLGSIKKKLSAIKCVYNSVVLSEEITNIEIMNFKETTKIGIYSLSI